MHKADKISGYKKGENSLQSLLYRHTNNISRLFSYLPSYVFANTDDMARCPHLDQTASIRKTVERRIDGYTSFAEYRFYIERYFYISPIYIRHFPDFGFKLKFAFHRICFTSHQDKISIFVLTIFHSKHAKTR